MAVVPADEVGFVAAANQLYRDGKLRRRFEKTAVATPNVILTLTELQMCLLILSIHLMTNQQQFTSTKIRNKYRNVLVPALLMLAFSLFYLLTLAPTVLWGDDAFFQSAAYAGTLPPSRNHWIWLQLAHLLTALPIGNIAFRANLLSAVAAVGTLLVIYKVLRALKLSRGAAVAATVSLAVAHTFWTHAVRAEVYTVFTFLMAVQIWLWFRWEVDKPTYLFTAAFLFGLTILGHQMGVLLIPALAVLVWKQRHWLSRVDWIKLSSFFVVGLAPFLGVMIFDIGSRTGNSLAGSIYLYFTHAGSDFTGSFFDFSLEYLVHDVGLWLGFLGLQFVGLSAIAGLVGAVSIWRLGTPSPPWLSITVLYATTVLFAISYRVSDHFVFFLPSYIAFVLFIGAGWQDVEAFVNRQWPRWRWLRFSSLIAIPLLTYYFLPQALLALDLNPLGVRQLPGREPNMFFLWPAKNDYLGAEDYGRTALETLPENSVLLADYTPVETLKYLQNIEGVRPDVELIHIPPGIDLTVVLDEIEPGTEVYLADTNPNYYNFSNLPEARLEPVGPIYRLTFQSDSAEP